MPLASASPPHLGHFTLQEAWFRDAPHLGQELPHSDILTSAEHFGHSTLRSPTLTSFPHLHFSVMSAFMSALHFEQCMAIVPESCDSEEEHPHDADNPRAITHKIPILIAALLSSTCGSYRQLGPEDAPWRDFGEEGAILPARETWTSPVRS